MRIIAHRGNINGPNRKEENTKKAIDRALNHGYDVEIDVWAKGSKYFLGHDNPMTLIDLNWINQRKKKLWIHTKNSFAFENLLSLNQDFMFFYYCKDLLVLTSNGFIWTHSPENIIYPEKCIIPLIGMQKIPDKYNRNWYGACTDYPIALSKQHA